MHYNESTDKMNKEKRISNRKNTYFLNTLSYFINANVIVTMALYFILKKEYLSEKLTETKKAKFTDFFTNYKNPAKDA